MGGSEQTRERTALSRKRIVTTALQIVDEEGIDALTMRRLAAALDVAPMAIYYHVPNKAALLDGIVEAVMSEIDTSIDLSAMSFEDRFKTAARAYRAVLVAHPNALTVLSSRPPRTPASMDPVEILVGILHEAGFTPAQAIAAVDAMAALVQGAVRFAANHDVDCHSPEAAQARRAMLTPERHPNLCETFVSPDLMGSEEEFEFGLDALVRGLRALLEERDR